ncbi:MAG TPA: serine/threonine-protein kinase [Kofleriaceae bacterium]|nr:serine/threonine-protein kinase [Kofleriaceae bacterium]
MGDREDLCGRTVGEFVLRERIDEGGFGAVYRCEQPLLGREAVVKVLHQRLRRNDVVLQRFMREAQLASRLDHPYAAHVYAFGIEHADGLFWIAMEMVQGTTLNRWLRDRGPLTLEQFVPFFERVAEVVQTAHERGIVHRDLKPSNVMVIERAGRLLPKLLDFGVAKLLDSAVLPDSTPSTLKLRQAEVEAASENSSAGDPNPSEAATLTGTSGPAQSVAQLLRLTQADATVGSPPYMSPEQWNNAGAVGPASDLYALGVVAYEALTGRRPFQGATLADYVELHCHGTVPPLGGNFPPALDRMFQRALAKRPEDRWSTALELAAALRSASGVGSSWVDLPRLDETVRDAWLADAPQPLAESIAALDGARNAHQARDAADDLVRNLLRYLLAIALATHAQVRADRGDPALLELVRTMRRRDLGERERVRLLRLLVRPLTSRRGAHPIPELVDLVTTRADGTDGLDPILALHSTTDHAGTEDVVRSRLGRLIPELTQLLRRATFVLDYVLVVARNQAAERWAGLRRQHRALATVFDGELVKDHPMLLDREGRICVDLWPLMQTVSPTEGAEPELFLFDGRGRHGALLIAAPAGFEHHDPTVWEWIAARVIAETDTNPETSGDDMPPYLGLTSYATIDAGRFVGRESEVDAFLNRLRQRPLQVVVGPSGAGKSSFVHAGVVPGLPSSWRTVTMRPGGAPLTALASRLAAANITTADLRPLLETSPAAAAVLVAHAALSGTIVLVIDQFEELFTLCMNPEERTQFAAVIAQLAASVDAPIRVICAIRDDFLMQLDSLAPLRPLLSPSLVLLGNPSRDTLIRIVIEPARRAGYALSDPELAQDMVSAVADRPGALALLSFTASRLWELRDRRFRQLTRKAYDAMGGIGGALGRHAEAILEKLSAEEQRLAREIFRHLVTAEGTRSLISIEELRQRLATSRADAAIDKLVSARLITVSDADGESSVEVIHDALISAWPRLQDWVREDVDGARMRDQIRAAARQWDDRGRSRGLLWRDEVLLDLERWLRRATGITLSDRETAFVEASRRYAQGAKRVRRLIIMAAFVMLAVFGAFQYRAAGEIREAIMIADQRLTHSYVEQGRRELLDGNYTEALIYFAKAVQRGDVSPNLAFMLARATQPLMSELLHLKSTPDRMWSAKYSHDGHWILTTDEKAARIWDAQTGELHLLLQHGDIVYDGVFGPKDTKLITASGDGSVRIWDLATGQQLASLSQSRPDGRRPSYRRLDISPDGRSVAAIHATGDFVDVWDISSGAAGGIGGTPVAQLPVAGGLAYAALVEFSSDGQWLAASAGQDVQVFDGRTWARVAQLPVAKLTSFSFDPTTAQLATASALGDAAIWSLPAGTRTQLLSHIGERISHIAFSPDGTLVVTATQEGVERVWRAATGELQVKLKNRGVIASWVDFDPSSKLVVSADDRLVTVSEAATGLPIAVFAGGQSGIMVVRFDPSSRRVIGLSQDGSALVWDVTAPYRRWSSPPIAPSCGNDVSLDEDRRFLAVGCGGHGTRIWDSEKDLLLAELPSTTGAVPVVSADGDRAAIASGNIVEVYAFPGVRRTRTISHPAGVSAVAFSRSEHDLVSASRDGALRFTRDGQAPVALQSFPSEVDVVAFTPDGRVVAAGAAGEIRTYDPSHETALTHAELPVRARSFRISPTGHRLVIIPATNKPTAPVLWDLDNNRLVARLDNHKSPVLSAHFVRGDREILTAGTDGVARRWDAETGNLLQAYVGSSTTLFDVALDPDGVRLVTAGVDGVLRFWDAAAGTMIWTMQAHKVLNALHFEGDQLVTRGYSGEIARWEFPKTSSRSRVETLAHCLPLRLDDSTGGLTEQPLCDSP